MTRSALIFLLFCPAFAALGHDFYLFYQAHLNPGVFSFDLLVEKFKFSALGFIWTTYSEESFRSAVASMSTEQWKTVDNLLTIKTFFATLGFAGIFIVLFTFLALFGIGPFANHEGAHRSKKSGTGFMRAGKESYKAKYKRK